MSNIYLIRHGTTTFNSANSHRIRAWIDVPLNGEGWLVADGTSDWMTENNIPVDAIFSSDLKRSIQTAAVLADHYEGVSVARTPWLRPWNLGMLSGMSVETAAPIMQAFQSQPDKQVPEGESFNDFLNRWSSFLKNTVALAAQTNKNYALVTHHRCLLTFDAALSNGKVAPRPSGPPAPGGIVQLSISGSKITPKLLLDYKDEEIGSAAS